MEKSHLQKRGKPGSSESAEETDIQNKALPPKGRTLYHPTSARTGPVGIKAEEFDLGTNVYDISRG